MNRLRFVHRDSLSCEPILRRMPNGKLLIVAQCGDVTEPAPLNRVYAFISEDEGETWSMGASVWPEDGRAVYLTEVTVLGDVIRVYLTLHNGAFVDWDTRVVASRDNAATWEDEGPAPCLPHYSFLRGMITLRDGALLMAHQTYPIDRAENARLLRENGRYTDARIHDVETGCLRSEDRGISWTKYPGVRLFFGGTTERNWIWSEPTLFEQADGSVSMLMRVNGTGRLYRSDSHDGGRSFSEPIPTDIPNPSNKPKLLALGDGRVALIHTPNPVCGMLHRNPLAVWISSDGMKTWNDRRVISDFPGAFCYPDGFVENGHLLFSIEFNRHEILFVDHDLSA